MDREEIVFTKEDRYKYSIMDVIQQIHGATTGSGSDYIPNFDEKVEWLTWRISEGWENQQSIPIYSGFNYILKQLASATLLDAHRTILK